MTPVTSPESGGARSTANSEAGSTGSSRSGSTKNSRARDSRARRALEEPMRVSALGDGRYEVATASGNAYEVHLEAGRCACPDHQFRGVRCKHLRRVAMEVTAGTVPAPGERDATCGNCGDHLYVDEDTPDPVYCDACTLEPGKPVVDRETGKLLVVVETTGERADEVRIPEHGWAVADHFSNADYDRRDVVVDALYPLRRGVTPDDVEPRHLKRYSFPRGRLARRDAAGTDAASTDARVDDPRA